MKIDWDEVASWGKIIPHAHIVDFYTHCYVCYFDKNDVCTDKRRYNRSSNEDKTYLTVAENKVSQYNKQMKNLKATYDKISATH